ncbi:MAG: choice-of-anchor B family protein [Bacteroidota bacterium]
MLKHLLCIYLWLVATTAMTQVSQNITLQGQWATTGLRVFSGVTYNDIWGYVDGNQREYAIMGSIDYTHFIDVSDPQNPTQIAQFDAPTGAIWRDFKTYLHYGFGVADDGNATLQIFDLSGLPNTVTKVYDSDEFFSNCHNIFIDEAHARLYAVGASRADIVVLDLDPNPAQPTLLQNINLADGYIHDIYVRDHLAYGSHVYRSKLSVYDLADVDNVQKLGEINSDGLNHSSWLTKNGNTLIMADETHGTALKVVNTEDLGDMEVVGTIKSTLLPNQNNSIPHNPFVIGNDYVVISYYHEGVQIYNISDPANPVRAGYYDTYPNNFNYSGFDGSWGVYPFLPSGNIIASDIDNGLFVLRPTFDMGYCRETIYYADSVSNEEMIDLQATESISLRSGFEVEGGGTFSASIIPCTPPNNAVSNVADINYQNIKVPFIDNQLISSAMDQQLRVAPNPFNDQFRLEIPEQFITENVSIQLINPLGQIVVPSLVNCGERCLSVQVTSSWSGLYTISIKNDRGAVLTKKVVKFQ